jgi:hypothetical protein
MKAARIAAQEVTGGEERMGWAAETRISSQRGQAGKLRLESGRVLRWVRVRLVGKTSGGGPTSKASK